MLGPRSGRRATTSLTLAEFAALVGATPRWCQNALQTLGRRFRYDAELAKRLGLARALHSQQGLPLRRAMAISARALNGSGAAMVRLDDPEGSTGLVLDLPRYLTHFGLRAARLQASAPRRRGRPAAARRTGHGLTAAMAYGLDLEALRSGLRLSPAERLAQLDANQRMIAELRRGRPAT